MQIRKDLPPRYYLDHFRDMIGAIQKGHRSFLEETHLQFLEDFSSLTEDAQCLYVRFVNRKGRFFFREAIGYPEIPDIDDAIRELKKKGFIQAPLRSDLPKIFQGLAKEKLHEYCELTSLTVKRTWSKPRYLEELQKIDLEKFPMETMTSCLVQARLEELSYLLFLFFGEISSNLSLFTLRDLGIWSVNKRTEFEPKFSTRNEARAQYFYARLRDEIDPENFDITHIDTWPQPINEESLYLRESLLVAIGENLRKTEQLTEALKVLDLATIHPGRERKVRLLYQMGQIERTLKELHHLIDDPSSDEELLFAEDFLERKFQQKKKSALSQMLENAEVLGLDEAYFRQPEQGVRDTLMMSSGIRSHHAENAIWRTLFGILFWHEIFESPKNTFHSPFERLPEELGSSQFYVKHHEAILEKLSLLGDEDSFRIYLESMKSSFGEMKNGLFSWEEEILSATYDLRKYAPKGSVQSILLYLAEDFHHRIKGFPDLLLIENETLRFAEIKAPGDSLRGHQLIQMNVLRDAGFRVDIVRVEYKLNPTQSYVIVDLETTGGLKPYHRITEIGAVKIRGGEIVETFQSLINPQRRISGDIQTLTGITNEMVKEAPIFKDIASAFQEFCEDSIFVAHNVQFDYGFLQAEYARLDEKFIRPFLCTKALMKKYFPGLASYGLANLTAHFQVPLVQHHRAMCDAEATAKLFLIINERRQTE